MGRYYSGDIEGKFMFAVQPSDAPERFYAEDTGDGDDYQTEYIVGYRHRNKVKKEIDAIDKGSLERVRKMFDESEWHNDETIKIYGVTYEDLREYADYKLGMKILEHFKEKKCDCYIYAEQ